MNHSNILSKVLTGIVWLGLISTLVMGLKHQLVGLNLVLALLITFVSAVVHSYSIRYMAGDRLYNRYFLFLFLITIAAYLMVTTDQIWMLGLGWIMSNILLIVLMLHKSEWKAAKQAAVVSGINLAVGSLALLSGIYLLANNTKSTSIKVVLEGAQSLDSTQLAIALGLIMLAALIQSAQWPFHKWLLSSLNSPTPVSALMHAGLINGGGILLAIFSPLYLKQSGWLMAFFVVGAITALLATYWKLVQNSIKRMLACSTMAQMGFMMMQCGLGFYSAAVVHLCWHGLFKAYLFLSSGSAVAGKANVFKSQPINTVKFLFICLIGLLGAWVFSYAGHKPLIKLDTTLILLGFGFMATAQTAYVFLVKNVSILTIALAAIASMFVGFIYGSSLSVVKNLLAPGLVDSPQPLNWIHLVALMVFIAGWAIKVLDISQLFFTKQLRNKMYVWALNASQPVSSTLTMKRNEYA